MVFQDFCKYFVLANLATGSIRVNHAAVIVCHNVHHYARLANETDTQEMDATACIPGLRES